MSDVPPDSRTPCSIELGNQGAGAAILKDLQELHEALGIELRNLAEVVEVEVPDVRAYTGVRWRLSNASRQRQKAVDEGIALLSASSASATAQVADLDAEGRRLARASTEHMARWSLEAVLADWPKYRRASRDLQRVMIARIQRERSILYPLLSACA